MGTFLRRFAGPFIGFLAGGSLEVSGYENVGLAIALLSIAGIWGAIALFTWKPIKDAFRNIRRLRLTFQLKQPDNKETKIAPIQNPEERKRASWMTTALNRDMGNLSSCMFVHNIQIDWQHLVDTDSYFQIHYDIYHSSVFSIDIGERLDGHLCYGDAELEREPEVRSSIKQLKRSDRAHLKLRQWVSQSMMNRITLDQAKEITLVFSRLNIWVDAKYPDGYDGPKCRLPIPDEYQVRIPTRSELEKQ